MKKTKRIQTPSIDKQACAEKILQQLTDAISQERTSNSKQKVMDVMATTTSRLAHVDEIITPSVTHISNTALAVKKNEYEALKSFLSSPSPFQTKYTTAIVGAIVVTSEDAIFLLLPGGNLIRTIDEASGKTVIGLTLTSTIGQQLRGQGVGATITVGEKSRIRNIKIEEII